MGRPGDRSADQGGVADHFRRETMAMIERITGGRHERRLDARLLTGVNLTMHGDPRSVTVTPQYSRYHGSRKFHGRLGSIRQRPWRMGTEPTELSPTALRFRRSFPSEPRSRIIAGL